MHSLIITHACVNEGAVGSLQNLQHSRQQAGGPAATQRAPAEKSILCRTFQLIQKQLRAFCVHLNSAGCSTGPVPLYNIASLREGLPIVENASGGADTGQRCGHAWWNQQQQAAHGASYTIPAKIIQMRGEYVEWRFWAPMQKLARASCILRQEAESERACCGGSRSRRYLPLYSLLDIKSRDHIE